jgi:type IV secretion system protein VirB4
MLSLRGVTQVVFDKDRGLEILVRALGGEYLTLSSGVPTGFNPLQLPPTAANVEFLKTWLRSLAGAGTTVTEWADVEQALHETLELEPTARRLSRLLEFLDPTQSEGIHARLSPWCHATRGDYAWVFDNCEDSIVPRLAHRAVLGVDVTEFLAHDSARTPVTLYLFHLVRQLLDGRRFVCWLDEFWRLLADAAFESFANDAPRTWRKLNGVMCLATQSATDVLDSPISRTLVEQTPTKIFFPNANARASDYIDGLGLSEREFRIVRDELDTATRTFLVKQGLHSIVCQLDLRGFESELAVISGRATALREMETLMVEKGAAPSEWLPEFMRRSPC